MSKGTFQKNCTSPPWLLVWLILYIVFFQNQIHWWKSLWDLSPSFGILLSQIHGWKSLWDLSPSFGILLRNIPTIVPGLALFLGVISIFFPKFRAAWLEYNFKLDDFEIAFPRLPEINKKVAIEIKSFLELYAPELQIKVNFNRLNQDLFIYASAYRQISIALFPNILRLWKSDQKVAEAILLHEIGHYRNGDASVIGAGNFIELSFRYCSIIIALFFIILSFLSIVGQGNTFAHFFLHDLPSILFTTLSTLTNLVLMLVLPIAGIWCAELNADRFMAEAADSINVAIRALDGILVDASIIAWLRSQVYHPPKWFRKWMLNDDKKTDVALLLIYPLSNILVTLIHQLRNLFIYLGTSSFSDFLTSMIINLHDGLHSNLSFHFPLYAVLLLVWPFISVYWVRFFSGEVEHFNWRNYKQYIVSAGILLCLSAVSKFI